MITNLLLRFCCIIRFTFIFFSCICIYHYLSVFFGSLSLFIRKIISNFSSFFCGFIIIVSFFIYLILHLIFLNICTTYPCMWFNNHLFFPYQSLWPFVEFITNVFPCVRWNFIIFSCIISSRICCGKTWFNQEFFFIFGLLCFFLWKVIFNFFSFLHCIVIKIVIHRFSLIVFTFR